jgi:hypothetical protein
VNHQVPKDDPTYIWSGSPLANWALTLRHKRNHVDLNGRWRTSKAGFHLLRPVVQLADGALLAGDHVESSSRIGWKPIRRRRVRWRALKADMVVETIDASWKQNLISTKWMRSVFTLQ